MTKPQHSAASAESEALIRAMLAASLDAIISMDHQGRVIEWNPAAERMFGRTRAQAMGEEMASLIIPERLRHDHREGLSRYLKTGVGPVLGRRIEMQALRADGAEFPVELTITHIDLPTLPTFTGFIRDITERKEAEAELRRREAVILQLSTPVLRLGPRILLLPIIGEVTPGRASQLADHLLRAISSNRAKVVILDLTGVAPLDAGVAGRLVDTIDAGRLLGAGMIVTGLSPHNTGTLVSIGADVDRMMICGDLQSAVELASGLLRPHQGGGGLVQEPA